jgi:hypothetical protein
VGVRLNGPRFNVMEDLDLGNDMRRATVNYPEH